MFNRISDTEKVFYLALILLTFLVVTLFFASIAYFHGEGLNLSKAYAEDIIFEMRSIRTVSLVSSACLLGVAGVFCQQIFRNLLASPSILGFESLAVLGLVLTIVLADKLPIFSSNKVVLRLFISISGALTGVFLILLLIQYLKLHIFSWILLAGIGINAFAGSLTSLILSLYSDDLQKISEITGLTLGSLRGKDGIHAWIGSVGALICLALSVRLSRVTDMVAQGERFAKNFGLNISRTSSLVVLLLGLMIGIAVFTGAPMPFLGLIAPIIARKIVGHRTLHLIFTSGLIAILLALAADLCARWSIYPRELDTGVLISLVGAPFFVLILIRHMVKR